MERKQQKITEVREEEVLTKDDYVLNRKKVNKIEIIKGLTKWVKQSFIFQNLTVHLPYEVELPIETQEELVKLSEFKKTGMKALEYLVTCVLAVGIRIGREMERYEQENKK